MFRGTLRLPETPPPHLPTESMDCPPIYRRKEIYAFALDASHLIMLLELRLHLAISGLPESLLCKEKWSEYRTVHIPDVTDDGLQPYQHADFSNPGQMALVQQISNLDVAIYEDLNKLVAYDKPHMLFGQKFWQRGIEEGDRALCGEFVQRLDSVVHSLEILGATRGFRRVQGCLEVMRRWTRGQDIGAVPDMRGIYVCI